LADGTENAVADFLADAPPEKTFWIYGGKRLKNIKELRDALDFMPDSIFQHHVDGAKNDFSVWVLDVIKDEVLYNEIKSLKKRSQMHDAVRRRIDWLEKAGGPGKSAREESLHKSKSGSISSRLRQHLTGGLKRKKEEPKTEVSEESAKSHEKRDAVGGKERKAPHTLPALSVPDESADKTDRKEKDAGRKEKKTQEKGHTITDDNGEEETDNDGYSRNRQSKDVKFFTLDFVQGFLIGLLIAVIGFLVYIRFF